MTLYAILLSISFSIIVFLTYISLKLKDKLILSQEYIQELKTNNTQLSQELQKLQIRHSVLNTQYENEIRFSNEKITLLQDAKNELSKEFKVLSNQIFENRAKQFSHMQQEQLEMLLKPFREQITNFSIQSKEQFNTESKDRHILKNELSILQNMNQQLSAEAINLTKALKGENKTQGDWGEMILERTLEESGLRDGIEYKTQLTLQSQDNKIYRPDVVVHLPQKRDIIIDSKVSLVAYERYVNEENTIAKKEALKEHLNSIEKHIKELSDKNYQKLKGIQTLEYILLFMPIEGAFLLALNEENDFFKKAYQKNILIVSPSTLLVTLKTIEHTWRIQKQQENVLKIALEAEAMYDKLVLFVEEMQSIGTHLQKAQDSYDKSITRLKTGRGNIIKRAQNIIDLGIKPKKMLEIKSQED
jgi:DNA recombination protein RmuC